MLWKKWTLFWPGRNRKCYGKINSILIFSLHREKLSLHLSLRGSTLYSRLTTEGTTLSCSKVDHSRSYSSKTYTLLISVHNDTDTADDVDDYNRVIGIAQLKAFSCGKKSKYGCHSINTRKIWCKQWGIIPLPPCTLGEYQPLALGLVSLVQAWVSWAGGYLGTQTTQIGATSNLINIYWQLTSSYYSIHGYSIHSYRSQVPLMDTHRHA